MQFLVPEATNRKSKYYPRHFEILAQAFGGIEWHERLDDVDPGNWTIVVRSPGSRGLGRAPAAVLGMKCAFDLLTPNELALLKSKNGRILVDLGWEILVPTHEIVGGLATTLADLGIDPWRVFLFHSNQAARSKFNELWHQVATTPPPSSIEYPVGLALFVIHQQKHRDDEFIAARREQAGERTAENMRSRLFVSFNGEVRPHRLYVGAALLSLDILDRGYFSLLYPKKKAAESAAAFRTRSLAWFVKFPRGKEFADAASALIDRLPIKLDLSTIPRDDIETMAWESQDPSFYDDSRFTIVVDTGALDDCLFVTEKALKPIINHSPFLLIASPGGVDLLRSYGFRTFEPFIRQHDSNDALGKLTAAIDEIERIARLSDAELDTFSRELKETCDYNAAHFWGGFPALLKHQFIQNLLALGPQVPL